MRRHGVAVLAGLSLVSLLGGCGGGGTSTPLQRSTVFLSVSPTSANVIVAQSTSILATISGTTNTGVSWKVNGVSGGNSTIGTVTASGLVVSYTAPAEIPSPATVTVTATSDADPSKTATATVTVTAGVLLTPSSASLLLDGQVNFSASVLGTADTNLTWSVNGIAGGDAATVGAITNGSTTALYTAPNLIPDGPLTVTAALTADATVSGSAVVTVNAGGAGVNQAQQSLPVKLGTSGGNVNDVTGNFCCSGTLGALVARNGTNYVLSNNHVLARRDLAQVGEHITQPGLVDTNCNPGTEVATFSQAVKINNAGGTAAADVAIAQVVSGAVDLTGEILQLGAVSGGLAQPAAPASTTAAAAVGMPVAKSGRTSGLTCSTVGEIGATVLVDYETGCNGGTTFTVTYKNQVVIDSGTFGIPGDSGSLIVNSQTAQPVALLYAGDSSTTIGNPIDDALNALPDANNNVPAIVGGAQHTVAACTGSSSPGGPGGALSAAGLRLGDADVDNALDVKERHAASVMKDAAVVGMGVGRDSVTGKATIVVFVEKGKPFAAIPESIEGVPTIVRRVERFHSYDPSCSTAARAAALR